MTNMGSWEGTGWGTGIAPPTPPLIPYPGYTLPAPRYQYVRRRVRYGGRNMVVGLISVAQLSLLVHFSGFQGITEV